ncbi:MAG: ABC transporter permease [bacterium]
MTWRNVWIVFRKEFLDVVRDRRTIISMILLPILIFPLLTIGLGSFAVGQVEKMEERSSPIIVIGSRWAPELVSTLQVNQKLQTITSIEDSSTALEMLLEHSVYAVIWIPERFENVLASPAWKHDSLAVQIWFDESYIESTVVLDKVRKELNDYRQTIVQKKLTSLGLNETLIKPFSIDSQNRASQKRMASAVLAMFLPYIVILITLTGATYPAIDLTAGEKERGTMETLLVSPASRLELVAGKFLTTMLVAMVTAFLAILSLFATVSMGGAAFQSGSQGEMQFTFDPLALGLLILLLIPAAAFFASALIAIAINARSYKEAQSYVYPLILLVIIPAIGAMMPGVEADVRMAFIPVLNVSLILRSVLMGTYDLTLILMTFLSSIVYALLAIFVAVRVFQKESVLLRT